MLLPATQSRSCSMNRGARKGGWRFGRAIVMVRKTTENMTVYQGNEINGPHGVVVKRIAIKEQWEWNKIVK